MRQRGQGGQGGSLTPAGNSRYKAAKAGALRQRASGQLPVEPAGIVGTWQSHAPAGDMAEPCASGPGNFGFLR